MPFQTPEVGTVIRYSYLWNDDYLNGAEEGSKDRPCVIVVATDQADDGAIKMIVAPVTHSPQTKETALEIPQQTKRRLKLDDQQSWVVLTELNEFIWPGPDLRPIKISNGTSFIYGTLSAAFFEKVRDSIISFATSGKLKTVKRTV